jgi:hypothetical protein
MQEITTQIASFVRKKEQAGDGRYFPRDQVALKKPPATPPREVQTK